MADWEDEGGGVGAESGDAGARGPAGSPPSLPSLPTGYHAQPAWGFQDRARRLSYEFHRVYGPAHEHDRLGSMCRIDEDLSYWSVTWSVCCETPNERLVGRWVTFAQARGLSTSRLTFERFSSVRHMRTELPALLHVSLEREDETRGT